MQFFKLRDILIISTITIGIIGCVQKDGVEITAQKEVDVMSYVSNMDSINPVYIIVDRDVLIKNYFAFMDSLTRCISKSLGYPVDEYALVHANEWILDSLKGSDYYTLKQRGVFQYDQKETQILRRGDRLLVPDSLAVKNIRRILESTLIDVNIPEYKLRLIRGRDTILMCPVRIGQPVIKYLALAGHEVNLRSPIGSGEIIRIEREPFYYNPDTGKPYYGTWRDDHVYTMMPTIPYLEPVINGLRTGAMIHATTNVNTIGKAYSHGCIGTTEPDAWTIYYNAPIGTKVVFRYDLEIETTNGKRIRLPDIYQRNGIQ